MTALELGFNRDSPLIHFEPRRGPDTGAGIQS